MHRQLAFVFPQRKKTKFSERAVTRCRSVPSNDMVERVDRFKLVIFREEVCQDFHQVQDAYDTFLPCDEKVFIKNVFRLNMENKGTRYGE